MMGFSVRVWWKMEMEASLEEAIAEEEDEPKRRSL